MNYFKQDFLVYSEKAYEFDDLLEFVDFSYKNTLVKKMENNKQ
jgi:hypothetical protein